MTAVVVTGSRDWVRSDIIEAALRELPPKSTVIHGAQRGADYIAEKIAKRLGHTVEPYPVSNEEWVRLGRRAGPIRNKQMLRRLQALYEEGERCYVLAFPLPESTGTPNCIHQARRAGFEVLVYEIETSEVQRLAPLPPPRLVDE